MNSLKDILVNTGAIAGFAGIVGLAVLAMLYFSQARDVRRLREWAGREPERAAEVELRAQQIASQAIAQAYESMAMRQSEADAAADIAHEQGVQVTAHAVEPAVEENVAAEDGAEIAEVVGSTPSDEQSGVHQETQQYDVLAAEMAGDAVAEQAAPDAESAASENAGEAEDESAQQPAEVAAQAEAGAVAENGQAGSDTVVHPPPQEADAEEGVEERQSLLAPSTPAAARAAAPLPPLPPLDTSEFRAVNRPPTPQIPDYYLQTGETGSGHFDAIEPEPHRRSRVPFAVAGVLVAVFAVILIATQIGGSDNATTTTKDKAAQRAARDTKTPSTAPRNPEINRPAVNVSVLNGTDTSGLAKVVGDQLIQAGFTSTTTGNRNDGTNHATSTVYYASGSKLEAQEVAKELKIKDVKQADEQTLAAGGSVPVIVVLGADIEQ